MMLRNYGAMTSLTYHEKQLAYNLTSLTKEIKQIYPDDVEINLSNPKYEEVIKNSAFRPPITGGLSDSLGLRDRVLDIELWRDLANGWCPVNDDTEANLLKQAVDTPKGKMIQFTKTASQILPDGSYDIPEDEAKKRRCGTEFLFVMGERVSTALGLMATEDPSVELRFKECTQRVMEEKVLPEMLKMSRIRKGADGVDYEGVSEILFVPFLHSENRSEAEFYHLHGCLLNVARGLDGELHSITTDEIGVNVSALDALFMSGMKKELEKEFNFVFEEVKHSEDLDNEYLKTGEMKTVSFDLPEEIIPANIREERSKREKEMEAALKAIGKGNGYSAKEIARHESRDEKTDKSPAELRAGWKEKNERLGWTVEQFQADLQAYKDKPKVEKALPSDYILEDSFLRNHKEVAFTEYQYMAHIHKQLLPYMNNEDAQRESTRIFEKDCHLSLSNDQMEYFKPLLENTIEDPTQRNSMQLRFMREAKFIHTTTIERDKYISESLMARKDEKDFVFDKKEISEFIMDFEKSKSTDKKAFKFAKGQENAIKMILTEPGAVCNVSGRAGAGKSTLLESVKEHYEANGFTVYGTSTSSTATKGLAESIGLGKDKFHNSMKMTRLLEEGKIKLGKKSILIWDEAGMADTKSFYEIIKHVNNAGAKLVLVGEKEQLQSVAAGSNFKILGEQFVTTKVNEINRQVDQWQREMVEDFASGRSEKALKSLYDNGRVSITKTEDQRLEKIANDYLNANDNGNGKPLSYKDKIIMASTNDDVDMINNKVRQKLQSTGELPKEEVTVLCKDKVERQFSVGDRVIFTKNSKTDDLVKQKILNADQGKVLAVNYSKLNGKAKSLRIEMDDGKTTTISLEKTHALKHAYATSVHKAQGQTKTESFFWASANNNSLHSAYVAASRHKKNLTMYLSNDMVNTMEDKMEGKEPTASMKKVAEWVAKEKKVDLPPDVVQSFKETRNFLNKHMNGIDSQDQHVMDRFKSIAESMAKENYKKTSHDYTILDGSAKNTYESIKVDQIEKIRAFKAQAPVEPPEAIKAQMVAQNNRAMTSMRAIAEQKAQSMQNELIARQQQQKKKTITMKK